MTDFDKNYKIIFRSGESELEISPESECRLVENGFTGFSSTGFDVKISSYASSVGGYAQRRRFAEREITLTFEIERSVTDELRRKIVTMMNPTVDCELEVEMFGVRRVIDVIPCDEAVFSRATFYDLTEVTLSFVAPTVFFRDTSTISVKFLDACPMLTFPMNFMSGAGTVSGMYRTVDRTKMKNPGDWECGIIAAVRANGGNVVNPVISCGDLYIKCPITLNDGDELVIDTRPKMKNIYKNGERFFTFDKNSTFFTLPAGESVLSVTCDSGGEYIDAEIEFTALYLGI